MNENIRWVVFSCSFPPGTRSTPRVAWWRRLRRAGAVAPKPGLYVLPATDQCLEAAQWLAQEARAGGADPLVMRVEAFEGLTDQQLVGLFHAARREDYAELTARADELERRLHEGDAPATNALRATLAGLRDDYQQVLRIDHFASPDGRQLAARLDALAESFSSPRPEASVGQLAIADYRERRWVTRPRPYVDRLACAWLIRRFIDDAAVIRYSEQPEDGDVAFDMGESEFSHQGNRCSFEVMVEAFGFGQPQLGALAEVVHEIDLHDGRYVRPEVAGIEAVLEGWLATDRSDAELEAAGLSLFDGLSASLQRAAAPSRQPSARR